MASQTFRIDGLRELENALAELPKATARNVLLRVLKKRAQPIADHAKSMAPTGATGNLAESIQVGTKAVGGDAGKAAFARTLAAGGTRGDAVGALRAAYRANPNTFAQVYVGPTEKGFYGQFQEFGTVHHGPQPFMRPAFDAGKAGMLDGIGDDLWSEIEKSAKRLARKRAKAGL